MTGAVESTTVKLVVQVALFPAVSLTVTVMVCTPTPTRVPAGGSCVLVRWPEWAALSTTTTPDRTSGTGARPWCSGDVTGGGQVSESGFWFRTSKEVLHVLTFPAASATVTVM